MPDVATFNGATQRIYLSVAGNVSLRDILSGYDRWTHDNHKFYPAFTISGYETIDAASGVISTLYGVLINGWRVVAQGDTTIVDGVLMVEGGAEAPFIAAPGQVLIKYSQPIKTETVSLGGASGVTLSQIENSTVIAKQDTLNNAIALIASQ